MYSYVDGVVVGISEKNIYVGINIYIPGCMYVVCPGKTVSEVGNTSYTYVRYTWYIVDYLDKLLI